MPGQGIEKRPHLTMNKAIRTLRPCDFSGLAARKIGWEPSFPDQNDDKTIARARPSFGWVAEATLVTPVISRDSDAMTTAERTMRPPRDTADCPDGRRARSRSSRAKIVSAMLDIVGNGDVNPSAARVAEVAGVGLRSVFRHFDDMDGLYREMGDVIEARVLPIIVQPPAGNNWRERLADIAQRRARVFEAILPYRISANLKRFQSPYLMQDYRRMLAMETSIVEAQLPARVAQDPVAAAALNVILSFQTWRLLRHDQAMPVETAQAVVKHLLDNTLAKIPD
jgi:AcrR family transcriptional regulator